MRSGRIGARGLWTGAVLLAFAALWLPAWAYDVKEATSPLDARAFVKPELRVVPALAMAEHVTASLTNLRELDAYVAEYGPAWYFLVEQKSGRVNLADGGAIPFIPGNANRLTARDLGLSCGRNDCLPVSEVEALARQFLRKHQGAFRIDPDELALDPLGSRPVGNSIYLLRFQWVYGGVPVEGASVFFRINNGNLIQVAAENFGDIFLDTKPAFDRQTAWRILESYLGPEAPGEKDLVANEGDLLILPVTPEGQFPDTYTGAFGREIDYRLVYRLAFQRPGVMGTWEALVDAHTSELLRFVDSDRYGHIHGGIRPSDGMPPEENRPFPFANTGLPAPDNYSDASGNFPGDSATSSLTGKYARINDACGTISNSTTTGDLDFLVDNSPGTDCVVPPSNPAGAGNTHSARTLFYNLTAINLKAQIYAPTNTWLTSSYITANVNGTAECNARSGGSTLYFYKHIEGSCNNLGEIPGVAMHEWGHSYDSNDGSGNQVPPVETYADWTAIIQTHASCTGAGFRIGINCGGFGDACLDCTGVRDCDWDKHASHTPWTSANQGSGGIWDCGGAGSYNGPCGWEDHCESGISTQALWDFVYRDLPAECGMDLTSAWMLEDRLWFTGVATLTAAYTCSSAVTNGCGGTVLYSVMRAMDDDGDGTANGTPHAHAIYHAMHRHLIDCNTWNDTSPQNQNQTSCPSLTTPALSGTAGNNQVVLNWTTGGASATRYLVYRNEAGCDVGFNRIAIVNAPDLTYTDTTVVNGVTYFYRLQAATNNDACVSPSTNCVGLCPQPCSASVDLDKETFNCADTVTVTVLDSSAGASPWTAEAWSTTDGTHKTLTLTNDPPGSANYTGSIATTTSASPGPGEVRVANGDTITVQFTDPDNCGGGSLYVQGTAAVDCQGPAISNVQVTDITDSTATVTWTTSEIANSRVTFGTATPPATNQDDLETYATSHSVTLTGLAGCTRYYFSVTSADPAGNVSTDAAGGAYYSFTTLGRLFLFGPDDVEGGAGGWTVSGGSTATQWHIDTCRSHTATHSWKAGASDAPACSADYANSIDTYLTSGIVDLGSPGHGYHLRYREWYDTEANTGCTYDPLRPQVSTDGGSSWTTLGTQYCGASGGWVTKDYDLSAYSGSNVRVRFHFHSDGYVTAEGWYVDDVEISKPAGCGTALGHQSHTFTDACSGTGSGVGNGYVDPGEDVTVAVTLVNTGMVGATNVSATLSTATPGITVTTATATFPAIAASGGTGASDSPHFVYRVDPGVACGTVIDFTLHAVCDQDPVGTDSSFTMTVGHVVPGGAVHVFQEAFSSVTPPAMPSGWVVSHSGSGNDWRTSTSGCTGNGLMYPYSYSYAADAWAFTPGVALQSGVTYTLNFNQKVYSSSYPEKMEVRCGASATSGSMTVTVMAEQTWANTACALRSPTFTVPSSGMYYIGFHCTSAANMWNLYVDDIDLTYPSTPSCTVQSCTPSLLPPGETGGTPSTNVKWIAGTTDCLEWGENTAAEHYHVYRGTPASLPDLLTANPDSCKRLDDVMTESCSGLTETPAAGSFFWYLVTGWNSAGEGAAGNATGGPRTLDSTGGCS